MNEDYRTPGMKWKKGLFYALPSGKLQAMSASDFGAAFGANPGGRLVQLRPEEIAVLDRQAPETKTDGGWQSLLVGLGEMLDRETGDLFIPAHVVKRIQKYAFGYGNGGWEDRLVTVFGRTLGPKLDGNL